MGSFFVKSATIIGLEIHSVKIEIDLSNGIPCFIIVGLPDTAINESKERIRSAVQNSGFEWPRNRIIVNLSPADLKKSGPHFDLAIAIGIILASQPKYNHLLEETLIFGELGLNGDILPIKGAFAFTEHATVNKQSIILPGENLNEACLQESAHIFTMNHLTETNHLLEQPSLQNQYNKPNILASSENHSVDFADIRGQEIAKRALIIAASGNHNILLSGPPGTGKTLLAKAMLGILPPLDSKEASEIMKIKSICGHSIKNIPTSRPFRSPHHSSSTPALVGGGTNPKPGEVTLAHRGVLFLDELPEFSKHTLNQLRQPIEDGYINISRTNFSCTYPSKFLLFGAMNPCPCGHANNQKIACICTPSQIQKYQSKISGPILDRIELHVQLQALNFDQLTTIKQDRNTQTSKQIKSLIIQAREIQKNRYKNTNFITNSDLTEKSLRKFCPLSNNSLLLIKTAFKEKPLSGRAYSRLLKTSRTIADLDNSEKIKDIHLAEALSYRQRKTI